MKETKQLMKAMKLFYSVKIALVMITTCVIITSDQPLGMASKIFVFLMGFDITLTASRNNAIVEDIEQEIKDNENK